MKFKVGDVFKDNVTSELFTVTIVTDKHYVTKSYSAGKMATYEKANIDKLVSVLF